MQEMGGWSLDWEDLEKEKATYSYIVVWEIPWKRSLVGYSSQGPKECDPMECIHMVHDAVFMK